MRKFTLFFLILYSSASAYSQKLDDRVLNSFFDRLVQSDSLVSIKEKLDGVTPVSDPVTGTRLILYSSKLNHFDSVFIKKYDEQDKWLILDSWRPVGLLKDTICIIDTTNSFLASVNYNRNEKAHHYFKVRSYNKYLLRIYNDYKADRKISDTLNTTYIYVNSTGIRGDGILVVFSFTNSKRLLSYYFDSCGNDGKHSVFNFFDPNNISME